MIPASVRFAAPAATRAFTALARQIRASILVLALFPAACDTSRPEPLPYGFTRIEERAVREVLRRDSTWRLATESDSKNASAIVELRATDPAFSPYFARDGMADSHSGLAFVLTRRGEFRVLYLRAEPRDSLSVAEVASLSWLDDGFVRLRGDSLEVSLFNSGEIVNFVWDAATRKMVLLPETPAEESPAPPTTGEGPKA